MFTHYLENNIKYPRGLCLNRKIQEKAFKNISRNCMTLTSRDALAHCFLDAILLHRATFFSVNAHQRIFLRVRQNSQKFHKAFELVCVRVACTPVMFYVCVCVLEGVRATLLDAFLEPCACARKFGNVAQFKRTTSLVASFSISLKQVMINLSTMYHENPIGQTNKLEQNQSTRRTRNNIHTRNTSTFVQEGQVYRYNG